MSAPSLARLRAEAIWHGGPRARAAVREIDAHAQSEAQRAASYRACIGGDWEEPMFGRCWDGEVERCQNADQVAAYISFLGSVIAACIEADEYVPGLATEKIDREERLAALRGGDGPNAA